MYAKVNWECLQRGQELHKDSPPEIIDWAQQANLNTLTQTLTDLGKTVFWFELPLPNHMLVEGQEVSRTAKLYPSWKNNPYKNLSPDPISNCSPCHYVVAAKETESKDSTFECPIEPASKRGKLVDLGELGGAWCLVQYKRISKENFCSLLNT